jgi:hypothetical protein
MSEYAFVSLIGNLKIVEDSKERAEAIKKLAEQGKRKLSGSSRTQTGRGMVFAFTRKAINNR